MLKNIKYTGLITCAFLLLSFIESCRYDSLEELSLCDTVPVDYQGDVVPILSVNCYRCHGATVYPFLGGGNRLEGYDFLIKFVDDGRLSCAINHSGCAKPMPQGAAKLSESDINTIDTWICQDAPNN